MELSRTLKRMAYNNMWANFRLHRAVGELSHDEYTAKRTSFFPSIHLTLSHILFVDLFYVDGLEAGGRGKSIWPESDAFDRDGTFAVLREMQRAVDHRLIAATDGNLDETINLERANHIQVETRGNVLLHLFQHQIHHRGQAHAMLAGTRVKPPQLDEYFLAEELHLREAELRELGLPLE